MGFVVQTGYIADGNGRHRWPTSLPRSGPCSEGRGEEATLPPLETLTEAKLGTRVTSWVRFPPPQRLLAPVPLEPDTCMFPGEPISGCSIGIIRPMAASITVALRMCWMDPFRKCCKFVVEAKIWVEDRQVSSSLRTEVLQLCSRAEDRGR
jgi:hypothetical protein